MLWTVAGATQDCRCVECDRERRSGERFRAYLTIDNEIAV
jgi:hypothetical protein